MSTFERRELRCHHCGFRREAEICLGLNARRSPGRVAEILEGRFQRYDCAFCGQTFVVEAAFLATDLEEGWLVYHFPRDLEERWPEHEAIALGSFEDTL